MNKLAIALTALGMTTAAAPAFAAAHAMDPAEVTCADYLGMEEADQATLAAAVVAELESEADVDAIRVELETACGEDGSESETLLEASASS